MDSLSNLMPAPNLQEYHHKKMELQQSADSLHHTIKQQSLRNLLNESSEVNLMLSPKSKKDLGSNYLTNFAENPFLNLSPL
jgi:hypothetical protein